MNYFIFPCQAEYLLNLFYNTDLYIIKEKKSNPIFVSFCVNWRMESQIYLFLK